MKCLCCGKPIRENASDQELRSQWHVSCIRSFFGTKTLPVLDVSQNTLTQIAADNTNRGITVPGVQKKMSLHLSQNTDGPRLTIVNYPAGYILKPQTEQYECLPEAEYLVMQMARETGISTVPFSLIRASSEKGSELCYLTKRIDRILPSRKNPETQLLAMEDFCQLEQKLTENKYLGSYERCAQIIMRYSETPGFDLSELFLRIVFSFVSGNSDMHLKNFSLIETAPESQKYVLSKAYDMLPVNLILPQDSEQMALTLNGKKRNLHRNDFLKFAQSRGLSPEAAVKMIRKIISMKDTYLQMCEESYLTPAMKVCFAQLIGERTEALKPAAGKS